MFLGYAPQNASPIMNRAAADDSTSTISTTMYVLLSNAGRGAATITASKATTKPRMAVADVKNGFEMPCLGNAVIRSHAKSSQKVEKNESVMSISSQAA